MRIIAINRLRAVLQNNHLQLLKAFEAFTVWFYKLPKTLKALSRYENPKKSVQPIPHLVCNGTLAPWHLLYLFESLLKAVRSLCVHLDLIFNGGQPRLTLLQGILMTHVLLKLTIQTLIHLLNQTFKY